MIFIKRLVILDWGSKILCVVLLALQSALLDAFFIKFDEGNPGRWVWIPFDVLVVILWSAGLIIASKNAHVKHPPEAAEKTGLKKCWDVFTEEIQYAYFSWIFYSILLVAKVWYMFGDFAENFSSSGYYNMTTSPSRGTTVKFQDSLIYSSTSLKVILSITGPVFVLLAYAHHDEIHNSKYKLMIEKLGTTASINVLDSLMLMGLLFVDDTKIILPFGMDHAVKFFTCCCFALPALPLLILRMIGSGKAEKNNFRLIMTANSALFLLFVDFPFMCIRMVLWVRHDIDISTFITKNVMSLFRQGLDVYNEFRQWLKSKQGGVVTEGTSTAEAAIEMSDKPPQV